MGNHRGSMSAEERLISVVLILALTRCVTINGNIESATAHLLKFGNNDIMNEFNPRTVFHWHKPMPCDPIKEKEFHRELQERANETDFSWITSYTTVCNVFKYFRCDVHTGNCICWHGDLFWAPDDLKYNPAAAPYSMDYGRYTGRCRVDLNRPSSCSVDLPIHEVLPKYKKPFDLEIFDRISHPPSGATYEIKPLESRYLTCVKNRWDNLGQYGCTENTTDPARLLDPCKSGHYFLLKDMRLLRTHGGSNTAWAIPPNHFCDEVKQDNLLRAKIKRTWDMDKIRELIMLGDTEEYCNPFEFQLCHNSACECEPPVRIWRYERRYLNAKIGNRCVPEEGVTCTRTFYYNGNWVNYPDECYGSFKCVLAPDEQTHICCDPSELEAKEITMLHYTKGRCRDSLLLYKRSYSSPRRFGKNVPISSNATAGAVSARPPLSILTAAVLTHLSLDYALQQWVN